MTVAISACSSNYGETCSVKYTWMNSGPFLVVCLMIFTWK